MLFPQEKLRPREITNLPQAPENPVTWTRGFFFQPGAQAEGASPRPPNIGFPHQVHQQRGQLVGAGEPQSLQLPSKIFPVKEKPVKTLLPLCFCRPRFPGCCGESDKVCRQGPAPAWQAGQPYSLPARHSRKLLPRPEALQVSELGQSPVGEKGLPRGS